MLLLTRTSYTVTYADFWLFIVLGILVLGVVAGFLVMTQRMKRLEEEFKRLEFETRTERAESKIDQDTTNINMSGMFDRLARIEERLRFIADKLDKMA